MADADIYPDQQRLAAQMRGAATRDERLHIGLRMWTARTYPELYRRQETQKAAERVLIV